MSSKMNSQNCNKPSLAVMLFVTLITYIVLPGVTGEEWNDVGERERRQARTADIAQTGYACEGSTLTIECGSNRQIHVIRAAYGRFNRNICYEKGSDTSQWDMQCFSTKSLRVVEAMCEDKNKCSVPAVNHVFHGDPCSTTFKYLELEYTCRIVHGASSTTASTLPSTATSTTTKPILSSLPSRPSSSVSSSTASVWSTTTPRSTSTTSTSTSVRETTPIPIISTPKPGEDDKHLYCAQTTVRNITWPTTKSGHWVKRTCPNNPEVKAVWRCEGKPALWVGSPDLSRCKRKKIVEIQEKLQNDGTLETVETVSQEVVGLTEEVMYGGDLDGVTQLMEDMVNQIEEQVHVVPDGTATRQAVERVNEAVVKSTSNVLDKVQEDTWKDLPQAQQAVVATRMIDSVEGSAYQLANILTKAKQPTVVVKPQINLVLVVNIVDTKKEKVDDVVFPQGDVIAADKKWSKRHDSINISGKTIKSMGLDGLAQLVFLMYDNLDQFLQPAADDPKTATPSRTYHPGIHDQRPDYYMEFEDNTNVLGKPAQIYHPDSPHTVQYGEGSDTERTQNTAQDNTPYKKPQIEVIKITESAASSERENVTRKIVNTNVISASVNQRKHDHSKLPQGETIKYTLEHKSTNNVFNPTCSFWNYSTKSLNGTWSNHGCWVVETNTTHTICECDHLTNFAVIMDVVGTKLDDVHQFTLAMITYAGCIVSIFCLLLAWITFQFLRNLQSDRNTIHKNLVICLLVAELLFLCGIVQSDKPVLCTAIAMFLHYFFLAAFAWMCLEGIQLYVMLIEVFEAEKSRILYYYIAAYGIPAIVVGISSAVDISSYGTEEYCWLRADNGFIWAFVGPVVAVITVNIVMLSIAIYMMCKHASTAANCHMKEKSKFENVKSWVKGALVLVVLLGLTWVFGLLYVSEHTLFMAYIFTILNSLQGLFIFIFHCLINDKVQKEYKKLARRTSWLPESFRVKYGGAKYSSGTPQSSSTGNYFQKLLSGRRRKRSSTTSLPKSTTPSTKWQFHYLNQDALNSSTGAPQSHSFNSDPTEDPDGYLEPVKIRLDNSHLYQEIDGVEGDLSMIDASVVDSEALTEYCQHGGLAIDVEKYKIKSNHRLSALSQDKAISESEYSDGELFKMTDKEKILSEYEQCPLKPRTESENDLMNNFMDNDSLKKKQMKRISSESMGHEGTPLNDLNDLNKSVDSGSSNQSMCLSTPNIKFKSSTLKSDKDNRKDCPKEDLQRSLPSLVSPSGSNRNSEEVAIEKLKKAMSNDDGLISLYHGKKSDNRLSENTEALLQKHRYRLTSSDC